MEFLFIVVVFVLLALAAVRWGTDSRQLDRRWFPDAGRRDAA
jgi:hypothetical protein